MSTASFISLIPARSYMEATPDSIGNGGLSFNGDGHAVDVRLFLPMNKQQAHLIFNRVAKWEFTFRFKIECPNDANSEYQVIEGGATWDRRDVYLHEIDLHPLDPVAGTFDGGGDWIPGYDFVALYPLSPTPINSAICQVTGYDDSGPGSIYTRDGILQAYFLGFAYIDDWTKPELWDSIPCGGVQFEIHIEGASFDTPNTISGGSFIPAVITNCILSLFPNSASFDGASPSTFKIKGDFQGGVAGDGYPGTSPTLYLDDSSMFQMTPKAWYPYEKPDGSPRYDTTTGEPL